MILLTSADRGHPRTQDAQANGFVATVKHGAEYKMGVLHAAYGMLKLALIQDVIDPASAGLGALLAPLSATQFAQSSQWTFHYVVSLIFALFNTLALTIIFRFRDQDGRSYAP